MRCEATAVSTSPRLYHNFFMQKIADCKNLLPPPNNYPYNTIVFLRNTAHSAHKNHEFCAKNSLSTLNKTLKSSEKFGRYATCCPPGFALLAFLLRKSRWYEKIGDCFNEQGRISASFSANLAASAEKPALHKGRTNRELPLPQAASALSEAEARPRRGRIHT